MKELDTNKIYNSKYGPYKILYHINNVNKHKYVRVKFINTGFETDIRKDSAVKGLAKDDTYDIDFNKIYHSNNYGSYKIISYEGKNNCSERLVKIKFLTSDAETITRLSQAKSGQVGDPMYGININKIYMSNNYGPFKFIEIINDNSGHPKALIEFIETKYKKIVCILDAINGKVRDDTRKSAYHQLNTKSVDNKDEFIDKCLKSIWEGMVNRCINPNSKSYRNYGNSGVMICDEWLDLDTFIKDAKTLPQFYKFELFPNMYRIDKDYLQFNIPKEYRIYSKNTCMFLSIIDNSNLRVIENKRDHPEQYTSKYYCVSKKKDKYYVYININRNPVFFGSYDDEVIAASVANYWQLKYHLYDIIPLLNNVPELKPSDFTKYNVKLQPMVKVIERQNK